LSGGRQPAAAAAAACLSGGDHGGGVDIQEYLELALLNVFVEGMLEVPASTFPCECFTPQVGNTFACDCCVLDTLLPPHAMR
jgi:hypothetical protein